MAVGSKPDNRLFQTIEDIVPEIYQIGDCSKVGTAMVAVENAARVARII